MMVKVNKKVLVRAAKELNDVLGLDPAIDTKEKDLDKLKASIAEAAGLLEEGDEITEGTQKVIDAVVPVKEAEAEAAGDEGLDEEGNDPEPEPEQEPNQEESKPKDGKKEGPKGSRNGKPTKKSIVEESLKKGATIEEMAKRIVDAGIDDDYEKNCKVVKLWLNKMGFDTKKATIEKNPVFKR